MSRLNKRTLIDISLNQHNPLFSGGAYWRDMGNHNPRNFQMRIADDGSDYLTFEIDIEDVDLQTLATWFGEMIGSDMRVSTNKGVNVWRGMLREMVFSAGGDAEIVKLDDMANEALAKDDTGNLTAIQTSTGSIESARRWGRKQVILDRSDYSTLDAEISALSYVNRYAYPIPSPYAGDDSVRLILRYTGYLWMLDWLTVELTDGQTRTEALRTIVDQCGQGLITYTDQSIANMTVLWNTDIIDTGLKLARDVADTLGDNGEIMRLYLDNNLVLHWQPVNFVPYYIKRAGSGTMAQEGTYIGLSGSNSVKKWEAVAGVIRRNTAYPIDTKQEGSPFLSRQDRYIEAVRFEETGEGIFESLRDVETFTYGDERKVT